MKYKITAPILALFAVAFAWKGLAETKDPCRDACYKKLIACLSGAFGENRAFEESQCKMDYQACLIVNCEPKDEPVKPPR